MPFTAEELEAMRLADEEIEREFEESCSAQYADAEISKWLDDLAVNDALDHKQLHNKRYRCAYREAHKDEAAACQRAYQREYRKRKRMNAEIKNAAPDTAIVRSGTIGEC